jgi:3,4-dihydroxy 2-butanone 4-phosphate synthase/GTP cyclohydrolase II
MNFSSIPDALKDLRAGRAVIVVDDASRENEGDIVVAAEKTTPAHINFMIKHARGLVCVPMKGDRLDALGLDPMVSDNSSQFQTAFTVSVDAKNGVTTGISAQDRWRTVQSLVNPRTRPGDLSRPGHLFPLRYKEGGVLVRTGHTEAAVDLARLAGLQPAAVICEIVDEDGSMARGPRLASFAKKHRLKMVTIADLVAHRRRTEKLVRRISTEDLPTRHGRFTFHLYEDVPTGEHHAALVMGDVAGAKNVLVRVHASCFAGNVLGSTRCECGRRWDAALRRIAKEGRGVALYMHQEGKKTADCRTLPAEERGAPPGLREYGLGAQILADLGLTTVRLLTNHPQRIVALEGYGLKVLGDIPI